MKKQKKRRRAQRIRRVLIVIVTLALIAVAAVIIWRTRDYAAGQEYYSGLRNITN